VRVGSLGKCKGIERHKDAAERETMGNFIKENLNQDGIDRRGFLKCMAWAGTGALCVMQGGVLKSFAFGPAHKMDSAAIKGDFAFAQISDSHIGFDKAANPDVTATLQAAIAKLNSLPTTPEFVLHTGDLTQLSKASEFDTLDQALRSVRTERIFFVPGEHDVLNDNGEQYRARYGKGTLGDGWQSFDHRGVHFIGLVNVMNLKAGGLGGLGPEQLRWLRQDVKNLKHSTPIVVFAHIPLWSVYPQWGWGTDDSEQALGYLKKFGSVSVLNGHIHQVMQKVEGNVTFHTAMSTAFPQPAPGQASSPGPMKVPAEKLRSILGLTEVNFVRGRHELAVVDSTLQEDSGQSVPATKEMNQ
jgi:3',5'-cyclic-AMP phosphodiesterase